MKVPKPEKMTSGNWYIRLRLGGESVSVISADKTDCIHKAEKIKADYLSGAKKSKNTKCDLTLEQAIEKYISIKEKSGLSPATIRGYDIIKRNRFQSAMKKPVRSIRNWQELYDVEAERYSYKTMANTWGLICTVLNEVCEMSSPKIVQKKKGAKNETPFLTPEEIKIFCSAVKGTDIEIPSLLCLSSLRMSELYGLTWNNVNLDYGEQGRIFVSGASVYGKDNKLINKPENKNETSQRYVKIFSKQLRAALDAVPEKSGPVVTMPQNTFRKKLKAICEQNGLTVVTVHGLRHSFASLAYSLEMPIKITMRIGGWKDYNTVLRIYTHLAQMDVDKYSQEMSSFFDDMPT